MALCVTSEMLCRSSYHHYERSEKQYDNIKDQLVSWVSNNKGCDRRCHCEFPLMGVGSFRSFKDCGPLTIAAIHNFPDHCIFHRLPALCPCVRRCTGNSCYHLQSYHLPLRVIYMDLTRGHPPSRIPY